jgi:hypothetical protein
VQRLKLGQIGQFQGKLAKLNLRNATDSDRHFAG